MTASSSPTTPAELRVTLTVGEDGPMRTVLIRRPGEAPAAAAIARLLDALRERGDLSNDGEPYVLRCDRLDTILDGDATLIAQGVDDGDVLRFDRPPVTPFKNWPPSAADEDREGGFEIEHGGDAPPLGDDSEVSPPKTTQGGPTASRGPRRRRRRHGLGAVLLVVMAGAAIVLAVGPSLDHGSPSATASAAPLKPVIKAGRYVQLASFRGRTGAKRFAAQLRAHHLKAHVIASNVVDNLYPAWQVVAVGPVKTAKLQRRIVRRARHAGFPGGLARHYAPVVDRQSLELMAGDYAGRLKQKGPGRPSLTKTISATVTLAADGTGTIRYDAPSCRGTLTVSGKPGAVVAWRESITEGNCTQSGRWTTRIYHHRLVMTWWRSGHRYWVSGRLRRTGG
jgi:hypothetical protein